MWELGRVHAAPLGLRYERFIRCSVGECEWKGYASLVEGKVVVL